MKLRFKNLIGQLDYFPNLQIYVAEFIIEERFFSFSGSNKAELYQHISASLDPFVVESYFDLNLLDEKTGNAMTLLS